jgi:hypothetical protein
VSDARIVYTPHPQATPESEAAALAAVYRLVIDSLNLKTKATDDGGEEKPARKER